MVPDGLSPLYNGLLGMLIETKLAPGAQHADAQFCSLSVQAHNAGRTESDNGTRAIVPHTSFVIDDALNGSADVQLLARMLARFNDMTDAIIMRINLEMPDEEFGVDVAAECPTAVDNRYGNLVSSQDG